MSSLDQCTLAHAAVPSGGSAAAPTGSEGHCTRGGSVCTDQLPCMPAACCSPGGAAPVTGHVGSRRAAALRDPSAPLTCSVAAAAWPRGRAPLRPPAEASPPPPSPLSLLQPASLSLVQADALRCRRLLARRLQRRAGAEAGGTTAHQGAVGRLLRPPQASGPCPAASPQLLAAACARCLVGASCGTGIE